MPTNYASMNVSKQARLFAKNIIDFYELTDTRQLGFWLGIAVNCDYIALAIYTENCIRQLNIDNPHEIVKLLRKELPENYFQF